MSEQALILNPVCRLNTEQSVILEEMGIVQWEEARQKSIQKKVLGQYLVVGEGEVALVIHQIADNQSPQNTPKSLESVELEFLQSLNFALGGHCSIVQYQDVSADNSSQSMPSDVKKINENLLLFFGVKDNIASENGMVFESISYYIQHPQEKSKLWKTLVQIGQ